MAIIGTMGLVGVAINDSIVVLAAIQEDEAAKNGNETVILEVVLRASRHVVATSLTTIAGFLPLIIAGGGLWPPLAVTGRHDCRRRRRRHDPSIGLRTILLPNPNETQFRMPGNVAGYGMTRGRFIEPNSVRVAVVGARHDRNHGTSHQPSAASHR